MVDTVIDCLVGRMDYAFGDPATVRVDVLMDQVADRQTEVLALILAPGASGSMAATLRAPVRTYIEKEANRLLGERFDADLEARQ